MAAEYCRGPKLGPRKACDLLLHYISRPRRFETSRQAGRARSARHLVRGRACISRRRRPEKAQSLSDAKSDLGIVDADEAFRSEEHTSELQSLRRNSYAVFCLKKENVKEDDKTNVNIT